MPDFNWGCSNVFSGEMKLGLLQKIIGLLLVVSLATAASVIQPTVDNAAAEGERELSSVGDAARTVDTLYV